MINRKRSELAATTHKIARQDTADRRARTRTLIQLGGIVSLSGISSLLDINEGDDLQSDYDSKDKSAILLGALSELVIALESTPDRREKWLQKGINILKTREYQKHT